LTRQEKKRLLERLENLLTTPNETKHSLSRSGYAMRATSAERGKDEKD